MKTALMQPYFFPYLGYFDLVVSSDLFVFYDDAAFSKNSWYNRNRILAPNKEWEYVRVSVQGAPLGTPVKEIRLSNKAGDLARTNSLLQAYRRAPYYKDVVALVNETFESSDDHLANAAANSIKRSAAYLGLDCRFTRSSELEYARDQDAVQKVIGVCKAVGATQYVNLPGGRELYDPEVFSRQGLELSFTPVLDLTYPVSGFDFVPSLSIIDVLMWCAPQSICSYLISRRA
ncbi:MULTISPECIES: WbqC family protein [unclassified Burkholderia]|uniref:WbqC family protein n=1 Tax=unclassified Burkholderia TaxID=2613784 RepID=UPI002AB013C3|nr:MULTISPECIES: WbqC family protein [unclassified Burkholderia]